MFVNFKLIASYRNKGRSSQTLRVKYWLEEKLGALYKGKKKKNFFPCQLKNKPPNPNRSKRKCYFEPSFVELLDSSRQLTSVTFCDKVKLFKCAGFFSRLHSFSCCKLHLNVNSWISESK